MKGREKVTVYFADTYCAWQKGAIENANKLIRRYITKKEDFNRIPDAKIKAIQHKLNRRPRENSISVLLNSGSSLVFPNFALAGGLYN